MKNRILFFFAFFFLAINIFAQNWSPILVNQKMNYQHSDSNYISHTIWVDSAFYFDGDSIFYFNRVVKDVPDNWEIELRNQPQFLSKFIVKQMYDIYTCAAPYNYFLMPTFGLGYSWSFTNNINAEITSILWQDVFGVMDSVKIVSLSDGNEIHFSKNFGILKFPDFENGGYFNLVGIQDTEYGESVPGFWEVYDFEVGDVFQYYNYNANLSGGGILESNHKKYTIISKSYGASSVSYEVEGIWRISGSYYGGGGGGFVYSNTFSETLQFIDSSNHITHKFNNELLTLWDCYSNFGIDNKVYSKVILGNDTNNISFREYGIDTEYNLSPPEFIYYLQNLNSDTLYNFQTSNEIPEGIKGMKFKDGLGWVESFWEYWEGYEGYILEGYIKDGDTVGTITPDSLLIVNIGSVDEKEKNAILFPNPAKETITVKILSDHKNNNYTIELKTLRGQLVIAETFQALQSTIPIEQLPAGFYIYVIKSNNVVLKTGKLIKQ